MQSYSLEILGTLLTIQIDTTIDCRKEFLEIEKMLYEFENTYSRFKKDNWLWNLNNTGKAELPYDGEKMLTFALRFASISNGYFDPTIIDKLEEIGYYKKSLKDASISKHNWEKKSSNGGIEKPGSSYSKKIDYTNVNINNSICTLFGGARIEFGGVGKGYALDLITKKIIHYSRFLINFGGDISAHGGGWIIGLEDPDDSNVIIGTITIHEGFFCASFGAKRKIGNHHHLLDPIHGGNSTYCKGTYVYSNSGILADAFATLSCIVPPEMSLEIQSNIIQGNVLDILEKKPILSVGIITEERDWLATSDIFKIFTSQELLP